VRIERNRLKRLSHSREENCDALPDVQRSKNWGGEGEGDIAWWDPRVRKENRETAEINYVLGMRIFLFHPQ
jgi:hypothetical protein